ncbi:DUF4129 domain-containing protein [Nocardioides hwasunensis]|uniref:DUF4129 domain-containing protein n=1 Tax=Nocardioides hwasunensis TaxID=397258 RepID=A0ABR8ME23_9ACTN|nr:DUF4129 domain-containing protein [Nocardioides hwasunensis]MBD3914368.1 DUF4129 domain-containing protein [Nocardioides hwasunensis]
MRAPTALPPGVRTVAAVAATSLLVVLVAWATLIGPDEVFTGPGPSPASGTTPNRSCIPLPEVTNPDGTTTVQIPDDVSERNYCDPPAAGIGDYRDLVEQNPAPLWVKVLIWLFLGTLLVVVLGGVVWLVTAAARELLTRRDRAERAVTDFAVLDEPRLVAEQIAGDAAEQDALLRDGDARNAIVAAWHRFEVQGERAGVSRSPSETSSEYAIRILDLVAADSGSVHRLAELYREARFSEHPITEDHRAAALAALAGIRQGLGVRT